MLLWSVSTCISGVQALWLPSVNTLTSDKNLSWGDLHSLRGKGIKKYNNFVTIASYYIRPEMDPRLSCVDLQCNTSYICKWKGQGAGSDASRES